MFNYKLKELIKIILNSKYVFSYPPKKKVMIYDSDSYDFLSKFFKQKDVHIFDNRHLILKNQKINLKILIDLILEFKLTKKNYIKRYLNCVKPKIVITSIDNNPSFYLLKQYYKYAKYISVQNARRSTKGDIFSKLRELRKNKKYYCDYVLVFNKATGELYKSFCSAKIIVVGSILSNFRYKSFKKKYDLMYISTFRLGKDNDIYLNDPKTTFAEYRKKENQLIKNLQIFAKNNNMKLFVLGAKITFKEIERDFFVNLIGANNFKFIPRNLSRDTYKIIDQSKLIISADSTLGYEAASRGNKVCFFSVRGNKKRLNSSNFGWPVKKGVIGKFWSNKTSYKEISRVVTYLMSKKKISVQIKNEMKNILVYDSNNKRMKNFLNKASFA